MNRAAARPCLAMTGMTDNGAVYLSTLRRRDSHERDGFPWTVPAVASLDAIF